jgi:hypothetical protein
MYHIELADPGRQRSTDPPAECERLRKPGGTHEDEFDGVCPRPELPWPWDSKRVGLTVEVKARYSDKLDMVIENWPRLASKHSDVMAKLD